MKSCVLFAGLFAKGETKVIEPRPTRDHTEKLFQHFNIPIEVNAFSNLKSTSDSLFIVQSLHHAPNLLLLLSDFLQKVPHIPMHLSDHGIRCKSTLQSNYTPLLLALTSSD